jgi:hypothetical protein
MMNGFDSEECSLLNRIRCDLIASKKSGSCNTNDQKSHARTFITNLDRNDLKRLIRYIKIVVKDFSLDYEIYTDAYSTSNEVLPFLIGFYVKGSHQDKVGPIINMMIKNNKISVKI